MNLEEYLQRLNECPDSKLEEELGIYDNFSIFLNGTRDSVVNYLLSTGNYVNEKWVVLKGVIECTGLAYTKASVFLQLPKSMGGKGFGDASSLVKSYNKDPVGFLQRVEITESEMQEYFLRAEHEKRQIRDYNQEICLHPYSKNKVEGMHHHRALALVVEDISRFILKESFQTCLPYSKPEVIYLP